MVVGRQEEEEQQVPYFIRLLNVYQTAVPLLRNINIMMYYIIGEGTAEKPKALLSLPLLHNNFFFISISIVDCSSTPQ